MIATIDLIEEMGINSFISGYNSKRLTILTLDKVIQIYNFFIELDEESKNYLLEEEDFYLDNINDILNKIDYKQNIIIRSKTESYIKEIVIPYEDIVGIIKIDREEQD